MYDIISFVVTLAAAAFLVGGEIFLAMRKRWWLGLLPIAIIIIFCLAVNLVPSSKVKSYNKETLSGADSNGNHLELTVRYDKDGKLVDFSELKIYDKTGELAEMVSLEFSSNGEWADLGSANIHKQDVEKLLDGRKLTGFSSDEDMMSGNMIKIGDGNYLGTGSLPLNIIVLAGPMLLLYAVCRLVIRSKDRRAGLRKLEIDNL